MSFSFNTISEVFVVIVMVFKKVLHERGFGELKASRAKNKTFSLTQILMLNSPGQVLRKKSVEITTIYVAKTFSLFFIFSFFSFSLVHYNQLYKKGVIN